MCLRACPETKLSLYILLICASFMIGTKDTVIGMEDAAPVVIEPFSIDKSVIIRF